MKTIMDWVLIVLMFTFWIWGTTLNKGIFGLVGLRGYKLLLFQDKVKGKSLMIYMAVTLIGIISIVLVEVWFLGYVRGNVEIMLLSLIVFLQLEMTLAHFLILWSVLMVGLQNFRDQSVYKFFKLNKGEYQIYKNISDTNTSVTHSDGLRGTTGFKSGSIKGDSTKIEPNSYKVNNRFKNISHK